MDAELQARIERQRALARERQRRRRANPEVKAHRAAVARQQRHVNPEVKAREAAAARQRRQANPQVRVREAAAARQRRQANPGLVKAQTAAARQRRQLNPQIKAQRAAAARQQRQANPSLVKAQTAAARQRRHADPAVPRTAQCVVPVCHSRSAPSSILYPLPAEPTQRQAWIDFVRGCPCGGGSDWNPPTNEISFVCSLHFAVRCFWFQRRRGCTVGYSKRLRSGAVPTLYPVEEECSSAANANSPDDTAERLASSDVEDAEGRTCNSLASIQSVAGQDRGHHAIDQDAVRRLARLARFELIFPKDVSTQCSVKMASKAASCDVRTVSKSVQCSV
ncbi:uncharacterized protein LOC119454029 isoform X1 [Dermacentor silvarum]|uniref:uncharacterized protein LOC119454029 isoform X1 n=1 Tax=Dermacentor silvarum TaxID=543639 RepID=UPI002100F547|nr:uncharacterized protein LOC119454029 isoform X1 [Dermacentor silvarum]